MAIDLFEGLRIHGPNAVDSRIAVSDRTSIDRFVLYHGLTVFDQTDEALYVYTGTTFPPASNSAGDWTAHDPVTGGTFSGTTLTLSRDTGAINITGLAPGNAQQNVNADWNATSGDAEIMNKPTDLTVLSNHNVTDLSDVTDAGSGSIISATERDKLTNIAVDGTARTVTDGTTSITVPPQDAEANVNADWNATSGDAEILNKPTLAPANAEANVQADWGETDTNSDAFIQNKPTLAPSNAEENVQADWDVTDSSSDAFIRNKPTIVDTNDYVDGGSYSNGTLTLTRTGSLSDIQVNDVNGVTNLNSQPSQDNVVIQSSTGLDATIARATQVLSGVMHHEDKTKLDGIEDGADVTDQSNVDTALGIDRVNGSTSMHLNQRGQFVSAVMGTVVVANPATTNTNDSLASVSIAGTTYNVSEISVNTNPLVGSNNHNVMVGGISLQGTSTIQIGPTGELNTRTTYGDGLSFTAGSATASPNVDIDLATDSGLEFDSGDLKVIDVPFTLQSNPNNLTFDTGSNTAISNIVIPHVTSTELGLMRTTHFDWVERVSQGLDVVTSTLDIDVAVNLATSQLTSVSAIGAAQQRFLSVGSTGDLQFGPLPYFVRQSNIGTEGQLNIVNVQDNVQGLETTTSFRPVIVRSESAAWVDDTPPASLGHVGSLGIDDTGAVARMWLHDGTWSSITIASNTASNIDVGRLGTVTFIEPAVANDDLNISSNGGDVILEDVSHINDVARNTFEYASIIVGGRILTTTATITIPAGYNDTDFILYSIDGGTTPQRIRLFRTDGTGEEIRVFHNATSTVGDASTAIIKIY